MPNSNKSALILAYQKLVTSKKISIDIKQKEILRKLDVLGNLLFEFAERKHGFVKRMLFASSVIDRRPEGIYIYGDVGRGKSFLMDLFHDNLPSEIRVKRTHFHSFMREIHDDINKKRKGGDENVIKSICKDIGSKYDLICFDEMQVNDIADAMIIGRLFDGLFLNGVAMVVTSNRHPDDLYKNGLQRERFTPFIEMFKNNMDIIELAGIKDYRLQHLKSLERTYFHPLGSNADKFIKKAYIELAGGDYNSKVRIKVNNRNLKVPKSYMGVAKFNFSDLCDAPLGVDDFLEIAKLFRAIIIKDIPKLKKEDYNQAIRFTNLIDALYEAKVKLICSAAAAPLDLYVEGERSFEFQRTASRLMEMQSDEYLADKHVG